MIGMQINRETRKYLGTVSNTTYATNAAINVLSAVWIIFPGIYNPRPSSLVTEAVCSTTQKPPKARNSEERRKRVDSDGNASSKMHPLESSRNPFKRMVKDTGSATDNHLFRYPVIIYKL